MGFIYNIFFGKTKTEEKKIVQLEERTKESAKVVESKDKNTKLQANQKNEENLSKLKSNPNKQRNINTKSVESVKVYSSNSVSKAKESSVEKIKKTESVKNLKNEDEIKKESLLKEEIQTIKINSLECVSSPKDEEQANLDRIKEKISEKEDDANHQKEIESVSDYTTASSIVASIKRGYDTLITDYINLRKNPYYSRIEFINDKNDIEDLYLTNFQNVSSRFDMAEIDKRIVKASFGEMYKKYINYKERMRNGEKHFEDLITLRDLKIRNSYFEQNGIIDYYLNGHVIDGFVGKEKEQIVKDRNDNNQVDVFAYMRNEQYNIWTLEPKNIIVGGCPGSGKTLIMAFRIAHLLDKFYKPEEVITVSPTSFLKNIFSDEFKRAYGLDNIEMYNTIEFYKTILLRLGCSKFKEKYFLDSEIKDAETLKYIYSEDQFNFLNKYLEENKYKDKVVEYYRNVLSSKYSMFIEYDKTLDKETNTIYDMHYKKFEESIRRIPIRNLIEKSSDLKEKNKNTMRSNYLHDKKVIEYFDFILNNFRDNLLNDDLTIYNEDGSISKDNNIFREILTFINFSNEYEYKLEMNILKKYKEFLKDKEELLDFYYNDKATSSYLIDYYIYKLKIKYKLNNHKAYQFELFYKMYALNKYENLKITNILNVSLDEYQDYSRIEIETLIDIFSNAKFNLYGDLNQRLIVKGDSDVSDFEGFDNHYININYRNSKAITDEVNKRFNKNFRSNEATIGKVIKISDKNEYAKIISSLNNEKCLIITNNLERFKGNLYQIILSDDEIIDYNKKTVIPPMLAKGLEYDSVIVDIDGMSKMEQYVSMTRAYNDLYIFNSKIIKTDVLKETNQY